MKTAIYPGSFDPPTMGHLDIIRRASKVSDKVIVAILNNPHKKNPMFSIEDRKKMLDLITKGLENVEIDHFEGLLVEYAVKKQAQIIIKGLRAISDFENEFQMALTNRKLTPEVETVFMMTNDKYSYLSSSVVKEILYFGGCIDQLVPEEVNEFISEKIKQGEIILA
ncbi:pantetheine-phosphate adenylyltransferase [Natranaerofaba carboxydovora]|uniref:pantetheine-phosphate adenylyltransferase n=1 Tax=Natranaerofaba carboxydovora TaxID=2742683 RepID=UPI001F1439AB|nr:pantetheine-phosphate adenylyltransferase [Natranaerofaba carboxydovora]UMZ73313.1 Phosphopantetheine adenylyltransferase [Natranaerofaba carboxydovora]